MYPNAMRRIYFTLLPLIVLAGCISAEVVSSEGGVHTLRTEGSVADNVMHVDQAMTRRALEMCPAGWDKLSERAEPIGKNPFGTTTLGVEWTIRCR